VAVNGSAPAGARVESPIDGRSFPALARLVSRGSNLPRGDQTLVLVTHLLPTSRKFISALSRFFHVDVVGIPYSSEPDVCKALERDGIPVTVAQSVDSLPALARARVLHHLQLGREVVVQEIGGYLAPAAVELCEYPNFLGVVEDTNNGHWRYEAAARHLKYPVVSIARSPIKHMEDRQVGQAVAFSVDRFLRDSFYSTLAGRDVLVLGYGSIGSASADALRQRAARVMVYDIDSVRLAHARIEGYFVKGLVQALASAEVVIGATGTCSIDHFVLDRLRPGAIVFSASSKRVEVDVAAVDEEFEVETFAKGVQVCTKGDRHFYLAFGGYPVNFRDNSVLGPALDAIYAELFVCIREVAARRAGKGLRLSWPQIHQEVARIWCLAHLSGIDLKPLVRSLNDGSYDPSTRLSPAAH
jgi:adenosylhomocysteinase